MSSNTTGQCPQLLSIELRILGALMEKQLTTPDQYPLTLNSLITACNQKSSRDPVSNHTQGEIARALQQLQHAGFVNKEFGSRAEKFSQQFIKHLELGKKHQALLCVMMLRGPQTLSELNTRTQRMAEFTDRDDLEHKLERLCNREVPYAVRLRQQPGQRGERYTHLFSGKPDDSMDTAIVDNSGNDGSAVPINAGSGDMDLDSSQQSCASEADTRISKADFQALKAELIEMKQELTSANQLIHRLYQLTGHEMKVSAEQPGDDA